jgi:AraC-like DNA-binding protein
MTGRTTSAAWVRGIAEVLAGEGLDVRRLCGAAGIDIATLDIPGARFPTEKLSRLWELAAEWSRNPAIGLAQSNVAKPANFDVVGYAMMSCPTLLASFERLLRYLHILSDGIAIDAHHDEGGFRVSFQLLGEGRPAPRQRVEFILVTVVTFCRWFAGRDLQLLAVELAYPEPADVAPYRDAFRCPIIFNGMRNSLLFCIADIAAPLLTSNAQMAKLHEQFASEYLERFDRAEVSYRAREAIVRLLPDGEPRRGELARALCMSERTLQRRLGQEGTSFHRLLNDTRRELAERYLGRLHLSLAETAYLLGFADHSSFSRACKRWFERPPGQYREELRTIPPAGEGDS